ncbi:MAG: YkgJ family cysteine cluster protein [Deltaproteobacteria bacterium]|nr:YkgJ family cysteine cluster protein [Deltaproteobacteria bacterium]
MVGASRGAGKVDRPWWHDGIRFGCQQCGACCRSRGEHRHVYLSYRDQLALAGHLGLDQEELLHRHCRLADRQIFLEMVDDRCCFLDPAGRCRVYPARPKQCQAWPILHELLDEEAWLGLVAAICPGVGQGRRYPAEKIRKIAKERDRWYGYLYRRL